jgi:hypothetical protein
MRKSYLFMTLLCIAAPIGAQDAKAEFDPMTVDIRDALTCRLDVPTYNGFALTIDDDDQNWKKRGWKKVASPNFMMAEYRLPAPIEVVAGFKTDQIAFTSSGVLAILDVADPNIIAKPENIANKMDAQPFFDELVASGAATREQIEAEVKFRKFLGENVLVDTSEVDKELEMTVTTKIARSLSNATTHPGKTFYGCIYRIALEDLPKK